MYLEGKRNNWLKQFLSWSSVSPGIYQSGRGLCDVWFNLG